MLWLIVGLAWVVVIPVLVVTGLWTTATVLGRHARRRDAVMDSTQAEPAAGRPQRLKLVSVASPSGRPPVRAGV